MTSSTDWSADDILAGAGPVVLTDEEVEQRCRDAMRDPESVSLVVMGRNGQKVEHRISDHERTHLSVAHGFEQESPPDDYFTSRQPLVWAPTWKRWIWSVEQRFDFRPEDFMVPKAAR